MLQSIPSDMEFDPNSNPPCYKTKEEVMCSSFFTVCDMVNWLERQSSDHEVTGSTLNPSDDDLEHVIYTFVLLCFRSSQDSDAGEVAD